LTRNNPCLWQLPQFERRLPYVLFQSCHEFVRVRLACDILTSSMSVQHRVRSRAVMQKGAQPAGSPLFAARDGFPVNIRTRSEHTPADALLNSKSPRESDAPYKLARQTSLFGHAFRICVGICLLPASQKIPIEREAASANFGSLPDFVWRLKTRAKSNS
jgi:hypothetical protein